MRLGVTWLFFDDVERSNDGPRLEVLASRVRTAMFVQVVRSGARALEWFTVRLGRTIGLGGR
jgi:hypothetical protein